MSLQNQSSQTRNGSQTLSHSVSFLGDRLSLAVVVIAALTLLIFILAFVVGILGWCLHQEKTKDDDSTELGIDDRRERHEKRGKRDKSGRCCGVSRKERKGSYGRSDQRPYLPDQSAEYHGQTMDGYARY